MLIAGRYRLDAVLGRGAMGEVWRAYDETLGRPVAVKLLLAQDSDPTAASRFRLEAQTAGQLNHPYLVGVLDFGAYDNRLFLVMELVEGESLAGVLAGSGALPAERVARIAAQAAAGLAAAHRQGVVHRDIKPGNLLMDADGTVKIGDFGIARFVDDPAAALTATGQIVGTSLYLAPERALGKPAGPASDVYSLGCVLYQLLTGRAPFEADSALAILHQHLDTPPVPPREAGVRLPPAFENYLMGLLAKQPEDRPTAQEVADWFATGAWQGRPEPLPAATASAAPARPATRPVSERNRPAGEAGPATTYVLPHATGGTGGHSRRGVQRRPRARASLSSRPVVATVVAGAVIFLAAVLIGMTWFAPDRSATETSPTGPGRTTESGPASPSSAPSTDPGTAPTFSSPVPVPVSSVSTPSSPVLQETPDEKPGPPEAHDGGKKAREPKRRSEDDEED
ncbi:serine/threonine-protein kinase [Streptomyces bullii]|uniref:non-specific serine/threonine protein kinase n=1 Tax=Streptomyces bullii TaxID=349910 RepID=A0ABW0UWH4_9ACTN